MLICNIHGLLNLIYSPISPFSIEKKCLPYHQRYLHWLQRPSSHPLPGSINPFYIILGWHSFAAPLFITVLDSSEATLTVVYIKVT